MRVAVLTQFFPPETFAGANRVAALATALAEVADVTVAAPAPSYPDPAAYADAEPPQLADRVKLIRVPATTRGASWTSRGVGELGMATRVARAALAGDPHVLVASSPSMFLGPAGLTAARVRRVPFVWDVRDLTWEYGREGDVVSGPPARAAIAAVARAMWWTARHADLVSCATEGLGAALERRLARRRVEVVANGIDDALFEALDPSPPPPHERTRVLYAGLVGHAQGLEVLLEVARLGPGLDVVIAGDGPRRAELENEARTRGLANVSFTGYLSPSELVGLYHSSDVLFAQLQRSNLHAVTAAPSKLLEYMAAGRPIVYAGEGSAADIVLAAEAGTVVAPGDAAGVVEALDRLTEEERLRVGRAARAYAERVPTRVEAMRRLAGLVTELS